MSQPKAVHWWALRRLHSRSHSGSFARLIGTKGDSRDVASSAICAVDGDIVTTRSGSRYRLVGEPMHNFTGFLAVPFDPESPLSGLRGYALDMYPGKGQP